MAQSDKVQWTEDALRGLDAVQTDTKATDDEKRTLGQEINDWAAALAGNAQLNAKMTFRVYLGGWVQPVTAYVADREIVRINLGEG